MAKGGYLGVGGKARKIKKGYIGIGGTARKIKKGYIGVGGVARLFYTAFTLPTFTGNSTLYGNESKGRLEITGSGTLTAQKGFYDVFIQDGGEKGTGQTVTGGGWGGCNNPSGDITVVPGAGGRGGYQVSLYNQELSGTYSAIIGGSASASSLSGNVVLNTSSGTKSYSGGGSGTNGSLGSKTTTKPFGGDSSEFNTPLSAGGSSASGTAGGHYGGGAFNGNGIANTGGGGGASSTANATTNGGSGKIIIRWGY